MNLSAVLVLLVGIGWGLLAPASKALYHDAPGLDGLTLAVARGVWAFPMFLIMLAFAWRAHPPRMKKRSWAAAVGAGLVFGFVVSTLFTIAAQHTSIAHISFIVGISPVTNTALAFRVRLDVRSLVALGLGIVGVVLLALTQHGGSATLFGDSLMIVWLIGFAAYAILLRAVEPGVSSTFVMALVGSVSMGVLIIPGLALGYGGGITAVVSSPLAGAWFFGEVILGSTLVGQTAYAAAVRRLGVSIATIGAEYTAMFVGVLASVATHEAWTPLTIAAGCAFCVALAVTFAPLPFLESPRRLSERT